MTKECGILPQSGESTPSKWSRTAAKVGRIGTKETVRSSTGFSQGGNPVEIEVRGFGDRSSHGEERGKYLRAGEVAAPAGETMG